MIKVNDKCSIEDICQVIGKNNNRNIYIINNKSQLIGIISQGDLIKYLQKKLSISLNCREVINMNPIFVYESENVTKEARDLIKKNNIYAVPVLDKDKKLLYEISAHDFL